MEFMKTLLAGLGGGLTVIIAFILFLRDRLEKIIDTKIEYQFNEKLENKKGVIEHKVYVSQHKFDKEFFIIQELMEKSFDFTYLAWDVYCTVGLSKDVPALNKYIKHCDEFTLFYMRNCAFIPDNLANKFDVFVKKINEFRNAAKQYNEVAGKVGDNNETSASTDALFEKYRETVRMIHDELNKNSEYSYDKLVAATRTYYASLEIK